MSNKKLLLLLIAVLLPAQQSLSAYHGQKLSLSAQEYGDTDSLIASTTQELKHAYDLLEMLKKRSEDLVGTETITPTHSRLPQNFDSIRDEMIKKQLIDVLSATPFSNPEKHLADCKAAITALEEYLKTLQAGIQSKETKLPQALPTVLSNDYDLNTTPSKPAVVATPKPVPAPLLPPLPATDTFMLAQKPAPQIKPVEPAKPFEMPKPINLPQPMEVTKPAELPKPIDLTPPVNMPKPMDLPKPMELTPHTEAPKPFELPKPAEQPKPFDLANHLEQTEAPKPLISTVPATMPAELPLPAAKPGAPAPAPAAPTQEPTVPMIAPATSIPKPEFPAPAVPATK